MDILIHPELRAPLATDLLLIERDGKPYKIALGDLLRLLPTITEAATVAEGDMLAVYDVSTRSVKYVTVSVLAGVVPTTTTTAAPTTTTTAAPTTTTAAPTTTTAAPTTTTTAAPTTTTAAPTTTTTAA
jgi:hypothetical protein